MKVIIPARRGSKGLPFKNRKLLKYTLDIIPDNIECVVTTNDEDIARLIDKIDRDNISVLQRPVHLSQDTTSTKDTMDWTIKRLRWEDEDIIMLYLTYPQREWEHVELAYKEFTQSESESLLCKKETNQSPYLILKEEDDNKGSQLFTHDLYRRQDYPKCFEVSHYVSIFKGHAINKLNNNLYNNDTIYFPIDNVIDVDEQKDLDKFLNGNK